ncbi:hypothetical protein NXW62_18960 [Bacteroides fragilis]|nr:hypothetical protein [Bacteroides fragilis]
MKIIAKQDSEGEILKQQNKLLLRDYERAVASGCFQGTLEEFKEFREVGCWGFTSINKDDFSDFSQISNELGGGVNGALGPLGANSGSAFILVPSECKYCKVRSFPTLEQAECFVSENPRMTDVEIITECEFVKAWNDRFYPLNRL